jgi:hypothetical protein
MSVTTKFLTGAAGLAALAGFATPAAAQYYPGNGYPNNNNIVGAIINSVTGYGRYPYGNYGYNQYGSQYGSQYGNQYGNQYGYNQNAAVDQCARAVEARLNGGNGYYGYGNMPYGAGYNGYGNGYGYGNGNAGGRVQGITKVRPQELWPEGPWRRQLGLPWLRWIWSPGVMATMATTPVRT